MSARVKFQNTFDAITPWELVRGQVGIIVGWPDNRYIGLPVMKCYNNILVSLSCGDTWNLKEMEKSVYSCTNFKIRLLNKNESVEVFNA